VRKKPVQIKYKVLLLNDFIQQGYFKMVKSDKDIFYVTKVFSFK